MNLSVLGRRRTQRPLLRVRATKLRAWTSFNADGLDSVGDGAVGGEAFWKVESDLDNSFDSSPPLQILVESWVVGDFGVDLLEGNIFKMRSELFACVGRSCCL